MSHSIPSEILLGISSLSQSGSNATWSLTKTSQGLSFTVTYPENNSGMSTCSQSTDYSTDSTYSDSTYSDDDALSILSIDSGISSLG
jgi:hypothetical protein